MELLNIIPAVLITGLVQVLKEFGLPSKYARIAAFSLAVLLAVIYYYNSDLMSVVVTVAQFGLAAIGLWEVAKPTYEQIADKVKDEVQDNNKV